MSSMKSLVVLVGVVALAGCASTTIFPGEKGSYSLVTTSSQQSYAEKDAVKKATDYCAKMQKQLVVINHTTKYNGVDKNTAAMVGLVGAVFAGGVNPARSSQDYQVTMKFACN